MAGLVRGISLSGAGRAGRAGRALWESPVESRWSSVVWERWRERSSDREEDEAN
jgi:hypothetical protein